MRILNLHYHSSVLLPLQDKPKNMGSLFTVALLYAVLFQCFRESAAVVFARCFKREKGSRVLPSSNESLLTFGAQLTE